MKKKTSTYTLSLFTDSAEVGYIVQVVAGGKKEEEGFRRRRVVVSGWNNLPSRTCCRIIGQPAHSSHYLFLFFSSFLLVIT